MQMESEVLHSINNIVNSIDALAQPRFIDWLAVILSGFSIIISGIAIIFAVRVANKQNKITLFEKRYQCYDVIQSLLVCADQIKSVTTNKEVQVAFRIYLSQSARIHEHTSANIVALQLKEKESVIVSGYYLFQNYEVELLQNIINIGFDLIVKTAVKNLEDAENELSEQAKRLKENYCRLCKQYADKYLGTMEEELQLNANK